ncbi:MAG TPA: glutamyl-tRNA reductase [Planctomycetes bacterium]|nr:glutamyl-tRNA reductase [Planctomycetota bacterium]
MDILLIGLNHKTASVDIRERVAFDEAATIDALRRLKNLYPDGEFVLLSTCNRVELYCAVARSGGPCSDDLGGFLAGYHGLKYEDLKSFLYTYGNEESVRHLLTVTSSLDSMVVGEPQITAQVKESYRLACLAGSTGKILNRLFHSAFGTSKDIYTRTSITNRRVSVAGVAVELARQLFTDVASAKVIVIGAGQMGELLIAHLLDVKCKDITVINRSYERAQKIAQRHRIQADKWDTLNEHITKGDIVVAAATATGRYLFDKKGFSPVAAQRRGTTLLVVDIAVPRNFEPSINELENVYLYCVDDLAQVVRENINLREDDIEQALEIIFGKVREFISWFETKDIGPVIGRIRDSFEKISSRELERFFVGNRAAATCRIALKAMVGRIVKKLLHCVIKNINTVAKEQGSDKAEELACSIAKQAEKIAADEENRS